MIPVLNPATEGHLIATTCSPNTVPRLSLSLWDFCPTVHLHGNPPGQYQSTLLQSGNDDFWCGRLEYHVQEIGTYFLLLDGFTERDKGPFELSLQCSTVPTPSPTSHPTPEPTPKPTKEPTLSPTGCGWKGGWCGG